MIIIGNRQWCHFQRSRFIYIQFHSIVSQPEQRKTNPFSKFGPKIFQTIRVWLHFIGLAGSAERRLVVNGGGHKFELALDKFRAPTNKARIFHYLDGPKSFGRLGDFGVIGGDFSWDQTLICCAVKSKEDILLFYGEVFWVWTRPSIGICTYYINSENIENIILPNNLLI